MPGRLGVSRPRARPARRRPTPARRRAQPVYPVLTSVWAEYELLDAPARRRRWAFKVHARDATVERAGTKHPRTGRQLAADLWTAWQNGATIPFKDVDHDADPTTRQVRIVGIAEAIAKPADAARWGDSTLSLTLVEV